MSDPNIWEIKMKKNRVPFTNIHVLVLSLRSKYKGLSLKHAGLYFPSLLYCHTRPCGINLWVRAREALFSSGSSQPATQPATQSPIFCRDPNFYPNPNLTPTQPQPNPNLTPTQTQTQPNPIQPNPNLTPTQTDSSVALLSPAC